MQSGCRTGCSQSKSGRPLSRIKHASGLAVAWSVACIAFACPAVLQAQTRDPIRSHAGAVSLVAVMPSSAQVSLRVFPSPGSNLQNGFNDDLLVIARQWVFARGTSLDTYCIVKPPVDQFAELVSLNPSDLMLLGTAFVQKAPLGKIHLHTSLNSGGGPQIDVQTLGVIHSSSHADPTVVRIVVVAI
jgi:hypothetical protein